MTTKAAELEPIVPMVGDDPSPQSMEAVKSLRTAAGFSAVEGAPAPLKTAPWAIEKSTGEAVMRVAPAGVAARAQRTTTARAPAFDSSHSLRMSSPLLGLRSVSVECRPRQGACRHFRSISRHYN